MKTVDTRGTLCPTPLIMTKRALSGALAGELFEILSDNDTARCNLLNYLQELGIAADCAVEGEQFRLTFSLGQESAAVLSGAIGVISTMSDPLCSTSTAHSALTPASTNGYAVVFKSQMMGVGDDSLGAILMRACINSLGDLEQLPQVIVMYNAGVMLAVQGSDTAESLVQLQGRGVEIIVCGTCVDFYGIKEQLAVGVISNMYKINTVLSQAAKVVYP